MENHSDEEKKAGGAQAARRQARGQPRPAAWRGHRPRGLLPPGQEDHLMCAIMERSMREAEEEAARNRHGLEIEQIFLEQGVTASQASASKEADLRVMKAEQDKIWIDLDSHED
ncbi:Nitrate reductase (NADH) [Hordeum vulgare]|nr:Nitrate reductase (NADH) [Hordeum vulgare]